MTRTFLCALLFATVTVAAADAPGLKGSAWVLSGLTGQALVAGTTVTLRFDGLRALGTDGCNRYTAPYTASGGALKVGPSATSTRMACPQERMDQAGAFLGALTPANAYRVESGQLQLMADGAAVTTRKMCAEPERVMEQEQLFLRALETVASARVEGDRLEPRTADVALAIQATRTSRSRGGPPLTPSGSARPAGPCGRPWARRGRACRSPCSA